MEAQSYQRSSTAEQILDVAQELIQRCGYDAISYNDLAAELDLTTAAIHYHFPTKADLGRELVARYRQVNAERRAAIQEETDSLREQLHEYVSLYVDVFEKGGVCLCGGLAAEESGLPQEVQEETQRFFDEQEDWLTHVINQGTSDPFIDGYEPPRQVADLLLAVVEGAMITKRRGDEPAAFQDTVTRVIDAVVR